jgi:hypothetical protein
VTRKTMGTFGTILQTYVQGSCDLLGVGNPTNPRTVIRSEEGSHHTDDNDGYDYDVSSSSSSLGSRNSATATQSSPVVVVVAAADADTVSHRRP